MRPEPGIAQVMAPPAFLMAFGWLNRHLGFVGAVVVMLCILSAFSRG